MKMTKKKVLALALAVCLLAIVSMGSLAWFSAADEVTNNFFVADSEDNTPDKIFSVKVWEKTPDSADDADGYDYQNILPGDLLTKEPHVENTGHYDQYIRVIVTISDATAWLNAVGEDLAMDTVFVGFDESKWTNISKAIEGEPDTVTYVLYYDGILESGKDITLFTNVKIPESLTQAQAAAFGGDFSITVKAQAVQTKNLGEDVDTAYEAFAVVEADQAI